MQNNKVLNIAKTKEMQLMDKITKAQAQKALDNLETALKEADTLGYYWPEFATLQAVIDGVGGGEGMKLKCDICGRENGNCNRYETRDGRRIVICPACLAFSDDIQAIWAREAHHDGRLVKDEAKGKARKGK